MISTATRAQNGREYQELVIMRFTGLFAEPGGFTVDRVRSQTYRSEHVEISFGFGGSGSFTTDYSVTTVKVAGRGQLEVPAVTYRLDRRKVTTVDALDAKLRKIMAKAADYARRGAEHAEQNRQAIARAQNDLALIRRVNEAHFPEFEGTGRELTLRGTHPDRDLKVTARIVSTREARRIAYNVACADDLTPEEAREVADLFLRLRRARAQKG